MLPTWRDWAPMASGRVARPAVIWVEHRSIYEVMTVLEGGLDVSAFLRAGRRSCPRGDTQRRLAKPIALARMPHGRATTCWRIATVLDLRPSSHSSS